MPASVFRTRAPLAVLLLLVVLAPQAWGQAGPFDTTPSPWHQQYPKIDFSSPQRLYAVNNQTVILLCNGYILRSTDEGTSWTREELPGCFEPRGAAFYGDSLIWLVGDHGAFYRSTDGGATWIAHRLWLSAVDLRYVSFVSPKVGWMGGTYGLALRTSDGGETWAFQDYWQAFTVSGLSYVRPISEAAAWLFHIKVVRWAGLPIGYSVDLVRTIDSGLTWSDITFAHLYPNWPSITSPTLDLPRSSRLPTEHYVDVTGMVAGSPTSALFYGPLSTDWKKLWTSNGGVSWDSTVVPDSTVTRFPKMFDSTRGWGTEVAHAYLYRSVNPDSMIWERRTTPKGAPVMPNMYDFIDTLQGWSYVADPTASTATIYETTDGASTWEAKSTAPLTFGSLRDVCFLNADAGWTVGAAPTGGIVMHTTNRGRSWAVLTSSVPDTLRQVQFVNAQTGWALGATLHVTRDGGRTWSADTTAPLDTLRPWIHYVKVEFVDSVTGWLVRSDWFTMRTTDGGASWQQAHPRDTAAIIGVARAVDARTLMAVGVLGSETYVFRILQGGQAFQDYPLEATVPDGTNGPTMPVSLFFLDSLHGWMVDSTPSLFVTRDAGLNWEWVASSSDFKVPGPFAFQDTSDGWFLRQQYRTWDDFGKVWMTMSTPAVVQLADGGATTTPEHCIGQPQYGLTFVGDSLGWTVGNNLSIYHYYLPASAHPHRAPFMTMAPPALDYGIVKPGTVKTDTIRIFNTGNDTLRIYRVQTRDRVFKAFHVASMVPPLLRPGDSTICAIDFVPTMYHTFYDTLFVYSNDDTQAVLLRGVGDVVQDVSESELAALHDEVLVPYPNPFAHETTIRLAGAQVPEHVGVYDAFGREVADLTAQARGGGPMRFRADAVAPGLYLCVARFADRTATQRLIVVR